MINEKPMTRFTGRDRIRIRIRGSGPLILYFDLELLGGEEEWEDAGGLPSLGV